jgi:hypothetical protein
VSLHPAYFLGPESPLARRIAGFESRPEQLRMAEAVEANLDLSAMLNGAQTPEQKAFDELVRTEGLKAALAWRDARYGEILGQLGRDA